MNNNIVFKSLVGSHNYNLNTEQSDKDYKAFVVPTFDDLYINDYIKTVTNISEEVDIEYTDIRKLENILYKSNTSFLEILFSKELEINSDYKEEVKELLMLRDSIAKMNLRALYSSSIGIYNSRRQLMLKANDKNKDIINAIGYDPKQAMHCYKILDFLKRFKNTDFDDFQKAIYYEHGDAARDIMLYIKSGKPSLEEVSGILDRKFIITEMYCKNKYKSKEICEETNQKMSHIIKSIVKKSLIKEFDKDMVCECN